MGGNGGLGGFGGDGRGGGGGERVPVDADDAGCEREVVEVGAAGGSCWLSLSQCTGYRYEQWMGEPVAQADPAGMLL